MKSISICKHINIKYFACHEKIKQGIVSIEYINIELMVPDLLTK